MNYVLVTPGRAVKKYPYGLSQLRNDNPQVSFSAEPPDALLAEWNVFPVKEVERPLDTDTENYVEGKPIRIEGVWTQVWKKEKATADQVAFRTEQTAQKAQRERLKDDKRVKAFIADGPQSLAGATDAQLREHIGMLTELVHLMARREFNR